MYHVFLLSLFFIFSCQSEKRVPLSQQIENFKNESRSKVPDEVRAIMQKANKELVESGIAQRALGKNNKLPDFVLEDENGKTLKISSLYKDKVLVMTFYRGGWCPYCRLELQAYETMLEDFADAGAIVLAISPESKMELKKTRKKNDLSFPLYHDENNQIAKKLGLSFKLSDELIKLYKNFNIDLEANQGNSENTLPMPGTYVIDKNGRIVFAFINPDYTLRAEPSEVLKVVKSLQE